MGPQINEEEWADINEVDFSGSLKESLDEITPFRDIMISQVNEETGADESKVENAFKSVDSLRSKASGDWSPRQPSSDSRVWRYLNFTQLMSILERNSIWFSNISTFNDPYEGTIPRKNIENEIEQIASESDIDMETARMVHEMVISGNKYNESGLVNCWNKSEYESAALWEQYIEATEGVAISTSVERLKRSLEDTPMELTFGEVKYINYETERIPDGILPTFYHKRKSFQHENEYRISFLPESEDSTPVGEYINVDVDTLIDKLYLAPTTQNWFSDQVKEVLETYNVDCELVQSDINSDPVY